MQMKSKLLLTILLQWWIITVWADGNIYKSTRVSTLEGLPNNTVRCMLQDQQGYLWMGTSNGISRYDGHQFLNYQPESSSPWLVGGHIDQLQEDRERHLLWAFAVNQSMACFDLLQNRFVPFGQESMKNDQYAHHYISSHHIILYDERLGLRRLTFDGGQLKAYDYTARGGLLRHNHVFPVAEDRLHQLWLPTEDGLAVMQPDGRLRYVDTLQAWQAVTCWNNKVYALAEDKTVAVFSLQLKRQKTIAFPWREGRDQMVWYHARWGDSWLLLPQHGMMVFDLRNCQYTPLPAAWDVKGGTVVWKDDRTLWLMDAKGQLRLFVSGSGQVRTLSLITPQTLDMGIRPRFRMAKGFEPGVYYIAAYGQGLYRYDLATNEVTQHTAEDDQPIIHSDYILDLLTDRSGVIWVSCDFIGLSKITQSSVRTRMIFPNAARHKDRSNFVRKIFRRADGTFTVTCRDGSLYHYTPATDYMELAGKVRGTAYEYFVDSHGHTWIGTRGDGVLLDDVSVATVAANIYSIAEDQRGRIWIATLGDNLLMTDSTRQFTQLLTKNTNQRRQHALCIDRDGKLWVGTDDGLYVADTRKQHITDADFLGFSRHRGNFCQNEIICLKADAEGYVWSGALGDGAARCRLNAQGELEYMQITEQQGLRNRNVTTIETDRQGDVWMGTDDGMARWDHGSHIVQWFYLGDDIQSNVFSENSSGVTKDGDVLMGTNYGLLRITPGLQSNGAGPVVPTITDLMVAGRSMTMAGMLPMGAQRVELAHDQNELSVSFSDFDFSRTGEAVYCYYLEGKEPVWSHTGTESTAQLGELRPGRYVFHVRMYGGENVETREQTLEIIIRQPWWNTWWAWLVYILVAAGIAALFLRQFLRTLRLRENLRVERDVIEFKLNFFTQISHEFRTPLSIIQNGVDQLEHSEDHSHDRQWLKSVRRGTNRMMKLIDQLLQFRRLNAGETRLGVAEGDIVTAVKSVYMDFWPVSDRKELSYTFTPFARSYVTLFDHQALETIVYNLLSNAMKYTPVKGHVEVRMKLDDNQLKISVANSGQPLTDAQRRQLFQPYMHGYVSQGGMGIGLYVAHALAELHHGSLDYEAVIDRVAFTLTLPADVSVYSSEEHTHTEAVKSQGKLQEESLEPTPEALNDRLVLVIEDDADMAEQLEREIGIFFRVETCADGEQGLRHACELLPDLVVCDVMLPGMDGYEITRRMKVDEATRHIPVILLTAFGDDLHHVKGIEAGADAFLTKPVSSRVLRSQMIRLMNSCQEATKSGKPATPSHAPELQDLIDVIKREPETFDNIITERSDKKFRERVQTIVAGQMGDVSFGVDQLMHSMSMGRTQFYKKCKEVMGVSPNEYIRNERMRVASELLQDGKMSVKEVAFSIGIDNISYFIRCFKARYGVSPAQYKKI